MIKYGLTTNILINAIRKPAAKTQVGVGVSKVDTHVRQMLDWAKRMPPCVSCRTGEKTVLRRDDFRSFCWFALPYWR